MSLKEGYKLVTDDSEIANMLNKHVNSLRCLAVKGGCSAHAFNLNEDKDPLEHFVTRSQLTQA